MKTLGQFAADNLALVIGVGVSAVVLGVAIVYSFTTMKGTSENVKGKANTKIDAIDSLS